MPKERFLDEVTRSAPQGMIVFCHPQAFLKTPE